MLNSSQHYRSSNPLTRFREASKNNIKKRKDLVSTAKKKAVSAGTETQVQGQNKTNAK